MAFSAQQAGCLVGRHEANAKRKQQQQHQKQNQKQNQDQGTRDHRGGAPQ